MKSHVERFAEWIIDSKRIVFFGGAGISTESGIPDFRSAAGIYQTETNSPYSPEEILSRTFFDRHTDIFYDFYRSKMIHREAKPNPAHIFITELERMGKLTAVVTQNIDGLHQLAGSKNVLELHGSIHRNFCMDCDSFYTLDELLSTNKKVPLCQHCNGILKPDVVLYEESLNEETIKQSIEVIEEADMLIIGGTSLTVYPAAQFVNYFRGNRSVLINMESTNYDHQAGLLITEPIGQVCQAVASILYHNQ